jgi:class 3 adenylate cyclase
MIEPDQRWIVPAQTKRPPSRPPAVIVATLYYCSTLKPSFPSNEGVRESNSATRLAASPTLLFVIGAAFASAASDNPTYVSQRERASDGMRKARVPERPGRLQRSWRPMSLGSADSPALTRDSTLVRLRALRSDLIEPRIAIRHGRVVKRTGDGLIVEFRSVVVAVRCAIEVQDSVEHNAGPPPERRIEFRVGIHSATSSRRATAISWATGQHRRTARRHCSPGDVCLSEDAYRQVKGRLDLAVSDLGPIQLKNVAEPIRVYSCKSRLRRQRGLRRRPRPKKPPPPRLSIVVLRFANVGTIRSKSISSTELQRA